MHLFKINILICYIFYMFRTRGFIFRKTVAYIGMAECGLHASVHAHTDTHYTIPVHTTLFLKMNPRVQNT